MKINRHNNQKVIVFVSVVVISIVVVCAIVIFVSHKTTAPKVRVASQKSVHKQSVSAQPTFNKSRYSTTDPASIWVVVNKPHILNPKLFQPADLVSVGGQQVSAKIAPSLIALIAQARSQGINLRVISGFRSYGYQANLYNSYVTKDGQAAADTYSARPGHSEHQTGLAVDIGGVHGCDVEQCFGNTPEGKWLSDHAAQFGFIVRYTEPKQAITGYQAEPWHLRYIGVDLVNEMKKKNIPTLEEFFNITGGATYTD